MSSLVVVLVYQSCRDEVGSLSVGTFAELAASKTLSIELAEDGCSVEETPLVHGGLIDVAGGEVGDHTSMLGTVERVLARAGPYVV